jgi:putative MFS transporter
VIAPQASVSAIVPAYSYLAAWFALAGLAYLFLGIETRGRSLETIEDALDASRTAKSVPAKAEDQR